MALAAGLQHGVDLCTRENRQRRHVEPKERDNNRADRTVELVEGACGADIKAEPERHQHPQRGGGEAAPGERPPLGMLPARATADEPGRTEGVTQSLSCT
jgi:hypothetical protein